MEFLLLAPKPKGDSTAPKVYVPLYPYVDVSSALFLLFIFLLSPLRESVAGITSAMPRRIGCKRYSTSLLEIEAL